MRRWLFPLSVALATLAFALIIAATGGFAGSSGSSGGSGGERSMGAGPFLAASALPPGVAGRSAPAFDLLDARGGRLASRSLLGRPYAITFLYTHCPDVCPLIGEEIRVALGGLGGFAARIEIAGISVDPRGDSTASVRDWLALHHEPANFHHLVGSQRQLASIWQGYSAAPQIPGDPQSSHTAAIWLIDRHGRPAALIDAGLPLNPGKLTHDFHVLIDTT